MVRMHADENCNPPPRKHPELPPYLKVGSPASFPLEIYHRRFLSPFSKLESLESQRGKRRVIWFLEVP